MRRLLLVGAAVLAVSCATPATPTSFTTKQVGVATTVFAGTLAKGSTRFYSFDVFESGTVRVMLASLNPTPTTSAPNTTVLVGFGVPHGTGCGPITSSLLAPALVPQMTQNVLTGTYCISIADVGNLTKDTAFAIRFTHS